MTFRQFAFNNVIRNKRVYLAHFLSSAFSVMIFFIYAMLAFHPNLQGELTSTSETLNVLGTMGMQVSQYIVFIFSFFFCLYSVGAYLKTRKREFGILLMHGMSPKQMRRMVFIENVFIGAASILFGVLLGIVFMKLILLIIADILFIQNGLAFYIPTKAVGVTVIAFALLFLIVSLFTSRLVRVGSLIDLFKSEEKPKPEPKASLLLSLLAVLFIAAGYGMVFYFSVERAFSFGLLAAGVGSVIIGTYLLFAQLSVYVIRRLKRSESVFLKRTNLLTISELAYRMKDNATMFFMVAVVSAVAFTGIGTVLALGDPGLAEMQNPYAFTYVSSNDNPYEAQDMKLLQQLLEEKELAYNQIETDVISTESGVVLMPLRVYQQLASVMGYEQVASIGDQEVVIAPTYFSMQSGWRQAENRPADINAIINSKDNLFKVKQIVNEIIYPFGGITGIVSDQTFDVLLQQSEYKEHNIFYHVPEWKQTKDIVLTLIKSINEDLTREEYRPHISSLVLEWLESKQENGILFILSSLVGIVFFTFAASFLYFRLFTDMERDQRQYEMISKLGLTKRELSQVVTRQLMLMFFLPIGMALVHSGVAFYCLQRLVSFSVFSNSVWIFVSFVTIQIVYFLVIRWRYLGHMKVAMR